LYELFFKIGYKVPTGSVCNFKEQNDLIQYYQTSSLGFLFDGRMTIPLLDAEYLDGLMGAGGRWRLVFGRNKGADINMRPPSLQ